MTKPTYLEAVYDLVGGKMGGPTHGPISKFVFDDEQTPPTEEAIQAKLKELQADYDAKKYQRDRQPEYPPMADQLDMQFHDAIDGTTTWQDAIQAVKDKYPKPE